MPDLHWDANLPQPIKTHGRALFTLRDVDEFIRDRCAAPKSQWVRDTLSALHEAAESGNAADCWMASERANQLIRANRWA